MIYGKKEDIVMLKLVASFFIVLMLVSVVAGAANVGAGLSVSDSEDENKGNFILDFFKRLIGFAIYSDEFYDIYGYPCHPECGYLDENGICIIYEEYEGLDCNFDDNESLP